MTALAHPELTTADTATQPQAPAAPAPPIRLSVGWNTVAREDWDAACAAACAPYQQDWAYAEALRAASPGLRVLRADIRRQDGSLVALAQILSRPVAFVARFALCTLGPVWVGSSTDAEKRMAVRHLKRALPERWPRLLVVTPDAPAGSAWLNGLSRVMTGDATVRIDLCQDEVALRLGLDGKWRNALSKSEKGPLRVSRGGAKPAQYRWLLEAEARQREARGYRALPTALTEAWQACKSPDGGDRHAGLAVYRADLGKDPCAGMLFLLHGGAATYHIGWSNEDGRTHGAHNRLMWMAMLDLKSRGVRTLDLGGVNTQSGAGIARFKLGTGGEVLARAGSFV